MELDYKIYKKAANRIKLGDFACEMIHSVCFDKTSPKPYLVAMDTVFKDNGRDAYFSYTSCGHYDEEFSVATELGILRRAIALDLMAEIVRRGDLP